MAENRNFNDNTGKTNTKKDNSVKDLIKFSDSDSDIENEQSGHTAAAKSDAELGHQQVTASGFAGTTKQTSTSKSARDVATSNTCVDKHVIALSMPMYPPRISADTKVDQRFLLAQERYIQNKATVRSFPVETQQLSTRNTSRHRGLSATMIPSNSEGRADGPRHQREHRHNDNENDLPKYPEYQTYEARLSTYELWPIQISQKKEQLASSGLYYTGLDDLVQCFHCGGNIRHWETGDDEMTEHARLFPLCSYIRTQKGIDFILRIQAAANKDDEENDMGQSMSCEVRARLEYIRAESLKMEFSDASIQLVLRHFVNIGNTNPTLEETVDALFTLQSAYHRQI